MRHFRLLRRDDRGVVDLPLKLLITAVVLAVTVPAGFKALQHYGRDAAEREAATAMGKLATTVQQVMSGGEKTSLVVALDLQGSSVASIEYARAGADLSRDLGHGAVLTFKVQGRAERSQVIEPNVLMQHRSGGPLELSRGTYKIQVTHMTAQFPTGPNPGAPSRVFHYAELFVVQS